LKLPFLFGYDLNDYDALFSEHLNLFLKLNQNGIESYGLTGGARAAEHLRGIMGELMIADVRLHPTSSLFTDFENGTVFKPQFLHLNNVDAMLDQVIAWSGSLKALR